MPVSITTSKTLLPIKLIKDKPSSLTESPMKKLLKTSSKHIIIMTLTLGNVKKSPLMEPSRMVDSWLREIEVMRRVILFWYPLLLKKTKPSALNVKSKESSSLTLDGFPKTASILSKLSLLLMLLARMSTLLRTESRPLRNKSKTNFSEIQDTFNKCQPSPLLTPMSEEGRNKRY